MEYNLGSNRARFNHSIKCSRTNVFLATCSVVYIHTCTSMYMCRTGNCTLNAYNSQVTVSFDMALSLNLETCFGGKGATLNFGLQSFAGKSL